MYHRDRIAARFVTIMTAAALATGCTTGPLVWSIRRGDIPKVEKHIDQGVDTNKKIGWSGDTALNLAVRLGNLQIASMLVEAGADVGATDGNCQSPLMNASARGDVQMVKLLLEYGADVNKSNRCQGAEWICPATALIAASWNLHSEVARILLEAGADVHHRDAEGGTALSYAIRGGWQNDKKQMLKTVFVLIDAGEDGSVALRLVRRDQDAVHELGELLDAVGAPNPQRLAWQGDYSEIAQYLTDWNSPGQVTAQ